MDANGIGSNLGAVPLGTLSTKTSMTHLSPHCLYGAHTKLARQVAHTSDLDRIRVRPVVQFPDDATRFVDAERL